MSAYVPRHAPPPPPRTSPAHILLAGLDAAVLAVAVLGVVLGCLALSRGPGAALSAPVPSPAAAAPGSRHPGADSVQRPSAPRAAAPRPYVVQRGDSLWSIAAWYYGDGSAWPRVYAANRAVIGPDPNLIRPGERLSFP